MVRRVPGAAAIPAARFDGGAAPICIDCGLAIATQGGTGNPQALRCVRCETERERLRAQPSIAPRPSPR